MKIQNYMFAFFALIIFSAHSYAQTVYTVTKSTDPDPFENEYDFNDSLCDPEMLGTLQWAIRKTNDTPGDCVIEFDIPGEGPHEILTNGYFPQINNIVKIDGTTQPGYSYHNPMIIINGQENVSTCFSFYNLNNVEVKGLFIEKFIDCGILFRNVENSTITENIIKLRNIYHPKIAGIRRITLWESNNIGIYGNVLGAVDDTEMVNISQGVFLQNTNNCEIGKTPENKNNTINNCYHGILLSSDCINNKISVNKIYDNDGLGINLQNDANQNKLPLEILSYDNNIISGTSVPNDTIEIFASTGEQNANEYLISTTTGPDSTWSVEVTTTYPYFIATATDMDNNTSELSEAFFVHELYGEIIINTLFNEDSVIFPFENQNIYGCRIQGVATLKSNESLIRIVLTTEDGGEFMVFESMPILGHSGTFNIELEGEEAYYLNNKTPTSIEVYLNDAEVYLEKIVLLKTELSNTIFSKETSEPKSLLNKTLDTTIVDTTKKWVNRGFCYYDETSFTEVFKFVGDTLIEGIEYIKVWRSTDEYQEIYEEFGFIHETTDKKVFYRPDTSEQEYLIYDLGANIGDTLFVAGLEGSWGSITLFYDENHPEPIVITAIDTIFIAGQNRRRLHIHQGADYWIEGIGSMKGMLHNELYLTGNDMYELLCYYKDDIVLFQNPEYNSCFIYTENEPENLMQYPAINIYPNPTEGNFILQLENNALLSQAGKLSLQISNMQGQHIYSTAIHQIKTT
ncbi:MAG: hypothetical protein U9Q98_06590, partial [Bacteroidota bacterium]|nr:hypothetical protein [Bacteroidota bacterium]